MNGEVQLGVIMKTYKISTVEEITGVDEDLILEYVECKLISPYDPEELLFDHEDLARIHFIQDLVENCGPNLDSLEVILSLVDRVHSLQREIKRLS